MKPDFIVLALVHPEILFAPIQDVTLPGLEVGIRISHHKADSAAGVAHPLVIRGIDLCHYLSPQQDIRSFQDGVSEIFIDTANGELIVSIIVCNHLTNRIFIPEMDIGELPAHHTAVPGHTPVGFVAFHQVIAEHLKEGTVRSHRAAIYQLSSNGKSISRSHVSHAATLLDLREVVLQMLVQPITHRHVILIGNHIDPVRILLEGIRGQLPLHIYRQQEHEGHRHREPHEVDSPV